MTGEPNKTRPNNLPSILENIFLPGQTGRTLLVDIT